MITNMKKIVIVGGGTIGWLTALFVKKHLKDADITLIASSKIGILGAGEGTTSNFTTILKILGIDLDDFREKTGSTMKYGINFINWKGDGTSFKHSFFNLPDSYALHFDARLVAKYLQNISEQRGIKYIDSIVSDFDENEAGITNVILSDGRYVESDFVFDCSGFERLIIGKHFKTNWKSYEEHLVCNSAFAFFLPQDDENIQNKPTWTTGLSMKNGWIWEAPLKHRWGCGYVYSDKYATAEEVLAEAEEYYGQKLEVVKHFKFKTGTYEKFWVKNCIAIGLASSFLEPMEATSLMTSIMFLKILSSYNFDEKYRDIFNEKMLNYNEQNMYFVRHHYICDREDSLFWKDYKKRTLPERLSKLYENGEFSKSSNLSLRKELTYGDNNITYVSDSWVMVYKNKTGYKKSLI
jgi:tryptophan halogenase